MSLRNSPELSPSLLDAARSNGRRSPGPRTAAGKQNCKMNAVKHGERSDPDNRYEVMRALREDPAQFEALKQEILDSFGPGDALRNKLIDDLAVFYWRRKRLERMETGLMRRALLEVEEAQHRRRKEIEGATLEAGEATDLTLAEPADSAARLRLRLSCLGVIRRQVLERIFMTWQSRELGRLYGKGGGGRSARLCTLLAHFAEMACRQWHDDVGGPLVSAQPDGAADVAAPLVGVQAEEPGGTKGRSYEADELPCKELLQLLEEEMAGTEEEFEYEEKLNEERTAIERDACLAPSGEEWRMLLRREEALDRAIDRKIKLLLSLRKGAGAPAAELRSAPAGNVGAPAENGDPPAEDVVAPVAGAQADEPSDEEPSPEGRGCQAPALSSAGA